MAAAFCISFSHIVITFSFSIHKIKCWQLYSYGLKKEQFFSHSETKRILHPVKSNSIVLCIFLFFFSPTNSRVFSFSTWKGSKGKNKMQKAGIFPYEKRIFKWLFYFYLILLERRKKLTMNFRKNFLCKT